MNFRLTLIMVIILLLVGSLYFVVKNHELHAPAEDTTTKNAVFSPAPKDLTSITYTQDGDKQLTFDKNGAAWQLTYPSHGPVNSWQVDPVVDGLKTLSYKEKFEPEASGVHSPEATGTDHPHNIVTFSDDAGKQHTLNLGKATIGGIYATIDNSKTIYLLTYNPLDTLQQDPNSFRDKSIKSIPENNITSLTITHEGPHGREAVTLNKKDGKWLIEAPITARANQSTADAIVNEMKSINATGFSDLSKTMPATGLNPPVVSVTAIDEEKQPAPPPTTTAPASQPTPQPATKKTPITLQLGYYTDLTTKSAVYASLADSKEVFTLSADSFKKLNQDLNDLRDPAITPSPVSTATEVHIIHAGKPAIDLKKQGDQWELASQKPEVKADAVAVSTLLADISNLRAIHFVDDAGDLKSIGLDPPQGKITLTIPGQSQQEVILVGKPETADKVTPFMRQGEPTVYLVQDADAEKVFPATLSLRDKDVASLISNDIQKIAVAGPDAPAGGFTLTRQGSTWSVTQNGKSTGTEDTAITALLGDFSPLAAQQYLATDDKSRWNLPASPDLTVTITSNESTPPATGPSTLPANLKNTTAGPSLSHPVTHTLDLYKPSKNSPTWRALWKDAKSPEWLFEPSTALVTHLTVTPYAAPATQPAAK